MTEQAIFALCFLKPPQTSKSWPRQHCRVAPLLPHAETKAQLGRWVINSLSKKPLHSKQDSGFESGSRDLQLQPPIPRPILATHSLLGSKPRSVSSQKILQLLQSWDLAGTAWAWGLRRSPGGSFISMRSKMNTYTHSMSSYQTPHRADACILLQGLKQLPHWLSRANSQAEWKQ